MFRGQFKFKTTNGTPYEYNIGDVVIEQGRAYECKKSTTSSPLQDSASWSYTGLIETFKGSRPPVKAIENQIWLSDNGVLYIYYKDVDGFQWVQV
jgi:hypothetical protein